MTLQKIPLKHFNSIMLNELLEKQKVITNFPSFHLMMKCFGIKGLSEFTSALTVEKFIYFLISFFATRVLARFLFERWEKNLIKKLKGWKEGFSVLYRAGRDRDSICKLVYSSKLRFYGDLSVH